MKTTIVLIFFSLFSFCICCAQSKISISCDASYLFPPQIKNGSRAIHLDQTKSKWGLGQALLLDYGCNKYFSISSGIRLWYLNYNFSNNFYSYEYYNQIITKHYGLLLSLNGNTSYENKVSLLASVGISFGSYHSTGTSKDSNGHSAFNPEFDRSASLEYPYGILLNAGVKYKMNEKLFLTLKGGFEMLSQGINLPDINFISGKNFESMSVGISYRFASKK